MPTQETPIPYIEGVSLTPRAVAATDTLVGLDSTGDFVALFAAKLAYIGITQPVNLDTIESEVNAHQDLFGVNPGSVTFGSFASDTLTDAADAKTLFIDLASAIDTNTAAIAAFEAAGGDKTDVLVLSGGSATLSASPSGKLIGITSSGFGVVEDHQVTVSGTTLSIANGNPGGLSDTEIITVKYPVATATPTVTRQAATFETADGTAIDLNTVDRVKIASDNTNTVFTASGGWTTLTVVNKKAASITVNGVSLSGLSVSQITDFGDGWEREE